MKKTLTDIDGALAAQRVDARPPLSKNTDITFGVYKKQDGQLSMGNKIVRLDVNGKTLFVDDTGYKPTPGLLVLITNKHSRAGQWNSDDYKAYKSLVAPTMVKSFENRTDGARSHATWKWKHMLRKMVIPGERIAEEDSEDRDDTDSVELYSEIASIGDLVNQLHLLYYHLILVYHHLVYHPHLPIFALMEKLKRRRIENLFINVME